MTLFFLHAVAIGDVVSVASVPISMAPHILVATTPRLDLSVACWWWWWWGVLKTP